MLLIRRLFSVNMRKRSLICDSILAVCIIWGLASILVIAVNCPLLSLIGYQGQFCASFVSSSLELPKSPGKIWLILRGIGPPLGSHCDSRCCYRGNHGRDCLCSPLGFESEEEQKSSNHDSIWLQTRVSHVIWVLSSCAYWVNQVSLVLPLSISGTRGILPCDQILEFDWLLPLSFNKSSFAILSCLAPFPT